MENKEVSPEDSVEVDFVSRDGINIIMSETVRDMIVSAPKFFDDLKDTIVKTDLKIEDDKPVKELKIELSNVHGVDIVITKDTLDPLNKGRIFARELNTSMLYPVSTETKGNETKDVQLGLFKKDDNTYMIIGFGFGSMPEMNIFQGSQELALIKGRMDYWRQHELIWDASVFGEPFESTWEDEVMKHVSVQLGFTTY
jgi:hypothetical protein